MEHILIYFSIIQRHSNDIFTLIHETRYHAMHTYYSNETQPYTYAGYKIFVAEVASTCNEVILIDYLLKHSRSDEGEKVSLRTLS